MIDCLQPTWAATPTDSPMQYHHHSQTVVVPSGDPQASSPPESYYRVTYAWSSGPTATSGDTPEQVCPPRAPGLRGLNPLVAVPMKTATEVQRTSPINLEPSTTAHQKVSQWPNLVYDSGRNMQPPNPIQRANLNGPPPPHRGLCSLTGAVTIRIGN